MPPHIVVLSSLFPSSVQPGAGLFIRERMFRVGKHLPLTVISPTPWFPLQSLIRHFKPGFRPGAPNKENQAGVDVFFPRFFSIPGFFKRWDGFMMALGALPQLRHLKAEGRLDIIDAHFAYPDGYAAYLLGKWLGIPYTVTLRGTESRHLATPGLAQRAMTAIRAAARVFSVADSLKQLAVKQGADSSRIEVVGNGVDIQRFFPVDRSSARAALDIPANAQVLISVGGLVPRKGFHRVIEVLPELHRDYPNLQFLIVGGASPEGNNRKELESQVSVLGLTASVRFLGAIAPDQLAKILSAADVFVLATSNEGWANVFLEAMACGLPVVTTDVGGNREVVNQQEIGTVVPFGDTAALTAALHKALATEWDRQYIRHFAEQNAWDERINQLCRHFMGIARSTESQS